MRPTELSIDIPALQVILFDKPSIEDSVKQTLFRLCRPPKTLEEINFFIESAQNNTNSNFTPSFTIDMTLVDKGITRAKFLIVEGEDDYI